MTDSPAYQFALQQGLDVVSSRAAAGGTELSSGNIANMQKFAAGEASQYEQQQFNQWLQQNNLTLGALQNMIQTGQISTGQLTTSLEQAGVNTANLQQYIGGAQAQGTTGAAAATAGGITGAAGSTAAGIEGATGANTSALANQANIINSGVQGAATQIAGAIPGAVSTLQQIPMSSAAPVAAAPLAMSTAQQVPTLTDAGNVSAADAMNPNMYGAG
jgi:hypothetical protein